jgi:hypothetical protein
VYALLLNFAAPRLKPNFLFPEASMSGKIYRLVREMTVSHADFLRCLPAALNNSTYIINGNEIRFDSGNRELKILLSPESARGLGPVSLPVTHVEFIFSGYTKLEMQQFLERFDMYYRRGGG